MAHTQTRSKWWISLVAGGLAVTLQMAATGAVAATGPDQTPTQAQTANMPIYGSQLMTDKERTEFRARMWAAQSNEERERIRAEHHAEMQKRAQERGMTLPEMPPAGMGRGGMGAGPCAASAAGCPATGPRAPRARLHRRQMMNR